MNATTLLIAALILAPATGLAVWAYFAMAQVDTELRSFAGFDRMDFEI